MFLRRLYFNKTTNEILLNYKFNGNIDNSSKENDLIMCPRLASVPVKDLECIEWKEEIQDIENNFRTKNPQIINGELIFVDIPESEPTNKYGISDELMNQIIDDYTISLIEGGGVL